MNKQTRDIVILAAVLLVLVIVVIKKDVFMGTAPAQPQRRATATATAAGDKKETAKAAKAGVDWIDTYRVPVLAAEVGQGRDPFRDLMLPIDETARPRPESPEPEPIDTPPIPPGGEYWGREPNPGGVPPLPIEQEFTLRKTLEWTSRAAVEQAVTKAGLAVKIANGARPNQITVTGPNPDYDEAVELITRMDVEPPAPNFALSGIIITPTERYVSIVVDGKFYSLFQGDSIPELGWTVKQITPGSAVLTKGKQQVRLQLAGGKHS